MIQTTDSFITQAEEALTLMDQVGSDGWCLCVKNGALRTVEAALRSLLGEYKRLTVEIESQRRDINGLAGELTDAQATPSITDQSVDRALQAWWAAEVDGPGGQGIAMRAALVAFVEGHLARSWVPVEGEDQ